MTKKEREAITWSQFKAIVFYLGILVSIVAFLITMKSDIQRDAEDIREIKTNQKEANEKIDRMALDLAAVKSKLGINEITQATNFSSQQKQSTPTTEGITFSQNSYSYPSSPTQSSKEGNKPVKTTSTPTPLQTIIPPTIQPLFEKAFKNVPKLLGE